MGRLLEHPINLSILLVVLSLFPALVLGLTSYLKFSVVFAILRNALGGGQLPPASLVALLSLLLTIFVMAPVAKESALIFEQELASHSGQMKSAKLEVLSDLAKKVSQPWQRFLQKHSNERERAFFAEVYASQLAPEKARILPLPARPGTEALTPRKSPKAEPVAGPVADHMLSLMPAFVVSELHEAFAMGFLLYLPFLVVDLVVANLLAGLGMMMVSPATLSLPIKLLLFVACDGWFLLCRALLFSYF